MNMVISTGHSTIHLYAEIKGKNLDLGNGKNKFIDSTDCI